MPAIHEHWTVLPHGPLTELDEGILTVTGDIPMPLGNFPRRMTVIALAGGKAAIWSAIALAEAEMARIEALGEPAALIVPGAGHRLDIRIWKQRYPAISVVCAPGARKAVADVIAVDDTTRGAIGDPAVRFEVVPGVDQSEAALFVRRPQATTLLLNDLIGNVQHPHGIGAWIMARLMRYGAHGPVLSRPGQHYVKDLAALADALRGWADEPGLVRVVVSHGDIVSRNAPAVLRAIADDIAEHG